MLKVSYGIDVADDRDPYVQIASDAMYATGNGGVPATSLVEFFPFGKTQRCGRVFSDSHRANDCPARHLPDWLVRDWPLKFAREWGWAIRKLHDVPFAAAEAQIVRCLSGRKLSPF